MEKQNKTNFSNFSERRDKSSHVQSVEKALLLVELLAQENREMSLTEISKCSGWPKSTIHGLLATLRDYRYIDQSEMTGGYRLGVRFFEVGNVVASSWDIRRVAMPFMKELNIRFGEMVQLATEESGEVLYLEKVESNHLIRIVSEIGRRLPMHCSGLGKAMLAYMSSSEVKRIVTLHGLQKLTPRTITTLPQLEKELLITRRRGYAVDDREIMEGLRCVAAPIFVESGGVRYAVSISGMYNNMAGTRLEEMVVAVKEAAKGISRSMGYKI